MNLDEFVRAINHGRDDMDEDTLKNFYTEVVGLCYKFEAQPEKLGQEILNLVKITAGE